MLFQAGSSNINHVNAAGRTLLSHAVAHGDSTIHTSRLLINSGAMVWPPAAEEGSGTIYSGNVRFSFWRQKFVSWLEL